MRKITLGKWGRKFMDVAKLTATWSKDPSTKVGCVIVDDDHNHLSGGFNGFPRGVMDDWRLLDRDTKLKIIVHAEANAVAAAARNGHSLKGSTAYVTLPPCAQCASLLIQAGVRRVIFLAGAKPSKWEADWELAKSIMNEAGVDAYEVLDERGHPAAQPKAVQHGVSCEKKPHVRTGALHAEDDDTPFDVDGVMYCGRCHVALP